MLFISRLTSVFVLSLFLVTVALFSPGQAEASAILNGNFDAGNTGFSSDYTYVQPPVSENMGEAKYTVWTDPNDVHSKWASMGDHTTGAGKMLIANGASNANTVLWSQDVILTPGATYSFLAWATGVYSAIPARLIFEIGDNPLGTLELTGTVPDWQQFTAEFTAITGGPIQLSVRDLETYAIGNDFALDDISLTIVPEPTTFLLLWSMLGMLALLRRR